MKTYDLELYIVKNESHDNYGQEKKSDMGALILIPYTTTTKKKQTYQQHTQCLDFR